MLIKNGISKQLESLKWVYVTWYGGWCPTIYMAIPAHHIGKLLYYTLIKRPGSSFVVHRAIDYCLCINVKQKSTVHLIIINSNDGILQTRMNINLCILNFLHNQYTEDSRLPYSDTANLPNIRLPPAL